MSAVCRCWLPLLLLMALAGQTWSQTKPAAEPPLLFRREYLPKTLLAREKEKLFPLPRKDFDQWLEKVQSRAAQSLPEAWIESIELRAVLQSNVLVGQARLQVRRRQARQTPAEPTLLSLAGLKLPVMEPKWEGKNEAATVGMTADGLLVALDNGAGALTFDWQLPGRRDPFGAELFDLSLAESSRSSMLISLPRGARLEATAGIVARQPSEDAPLETWSVQLGGARETRLRYVPSGSVVSGPLVLVREENNCTVAQGELETQCQLQLDVYREAVSRLEVELVGDWSPTSVRQGDTQIPFELAGDGRTAVLRFEPPLAGLNRRLTFTGRAAVQEGERVVAPRVRIKDAAWLDGTLAVDATKVLLRNWELQGVQRPANEQMPGAARRWALQSDQALAAFVVEQLPAGVRAETGSTVRLDVEAATASVVSDFTADTPGAFELAADVAPGWIIDSLEIVPPQALDGWEVVPRESRQFLRVALRRSVGPTRGVRVTIEAHRQAPAPAENLDDDQLRPVRWQVESKGFLALGIDPLWQVEFRGDRAQRIDPSLLTTAQIERLALAEDVLLFADDDTFDSARLELAAETPQFTAAWDLRVAVDSNRFRQQTELRIEPTATPVERLHVLVRPPAGKSLQWQLPGDDSSALEARLVRGSDDPAGEDEWELTLVRARRNPFTLLATLESEASGKYSARFFRCVEASSQPARIVLAGEADSRPAVEQASGLERRWNDDADSGDVAIWTFDPAQSPTLAVRLGTLPELRQLLLVERCALETRLTKQHLLHSVEYTIVNQQAQSFLVRMPPGSDLDQVLVDDRRVDPRFSAGGEQVSIPLPKQTAAFHLRIAFRTPLALHGATLLIEPAWPEVSTPAATRTWRAVFPDQYRQLSWSSPASWTWGQLWRRLQAPLPGFEPREIASDSSSPLACRQLDFSSVSGLPASIRLIDGSALSGLSWLLLAGCWAAVAMRRSMLPSQLAFLVGTLGLIALWLPASFDPIGRMMLLGGAAGLLTRQMRRWPAPSAPAQESRSLTPATLGAVLLVFLACAASAARLVAQERKAGDIIHRVIFPVDEAGKPVDDYVYTSEPFYKELFRRANQPAAGGPAAIVLSAEYRVRPRSDALAWDSIDATLTIEALQAGALQISWPREGFLIPPERVRLDGRAAPIAWNTQGTSFTISVESVGRHTVQFVAQPTKVDEARCVLSLPPAATARLLLDTLDDAAQVQTWPGPLPVAVTGEDGVQTVELGQRRDVTLITRPIDAPPTEIEAEQLLWANLWRGGGVIEGRWRFQVASGTLTEAVVDIGEDLELVSAAALTPAAVQWRPAEDGTSRMIWSPRTPTDDLVVEAVLLWRGSAADRILPRIEPRNANVTRRWLAIDPRGNAELLLARADEKVDVADFAALWNAEDWPATAQSLSQSGPVPLGTSAPAGGLSYEAKTTCEIAAKATHFEFRVDVRNLANPTTLIRLAVPEGTSISSAEVGVAGQFRAVPWLPLAGNEIALLPAEPLRSGNVLVVRGELSRQGNQQLFSPPSVSGGEVHSHSVEVTRRSDVRVTLIGHEGFRLLEPASESSPGIAVARFELDEKHSDTNQLQWTLEPNHPRTVGILVTTLRPNGQQWIARLDAFLAVRDGVVDAFHLESSSGWSSPKVVAGDATLQTKEMPGGIRHIELKPRGAPGNRYHIACEGSIPAQRVQTPRFRLLSAENVQQYVRLPRGEKYPWSTSGMQEASLPAAATIPGDDDLIVYRAAVPQFHVELLANESTPAAPRVAWGTVNLSARADGSFVAFADLAVDPSRAAVLPVSLPADALLVQAAVEGEAALAKFKGQRRFDVPLRSSTLPQMVRIVYSGDHVPDGDLSELAPRFDSWKLAQPLSVAGNGNASAPPALDKIVALLTPVFREPPQPEDELATWASTWLVRLKAALADAADSASRADLQAANELRDRLQALVDSDIMVEDDALPSTEQPDSPAVVSSNSSGPWLAALLVWAGIVAGGYRASQSTRLQELVRRWPSACAALVALAVAVLLSPSIGGALLAIAAASSLAWPWQQPGR